MVLSIFLLASVSAIVIGPLFQPFCRPSGSACGMALYCVASLLAVAAPSFETLLLARALQGLLEPRRRAMLPRSFAIADAGGAWRAVVFAAMMVFIAVPVVAPSFGQAVLLLTQWRGIFIVLMLYGVVAFVWSALRDAGDAAGGAAIRLRLARCSAPTGRPSPTPDARLRARHRWRAGLAVRLRVFVTADLHRDLPARALFPAAFAACAVGVAIAGFVNSGRAGGMRVISHSALIGLSPFQPSMLVAARTGTLGLPCSWRWPR